MSNLENRNSFSLLCLQMETQLVHANMQAIHNAFRSLSVEEGEGLIEVIIYLYTGGFGVSLSVKHNITCSQYCQTLRFSLYNQIDNFLFY